MKSKVWLCLAILCWILGMVVAMVAGCLLDVAYASDGLVVRVIDGDTMAVVIDGKTTTVRLYGVDAPEKKQPYGTDAGKYLASLVEGKIVQVDEVATDRYGRVVAEVSVAGDGVQMQMVDAGYAWVYYQYCRQRPYCDDLGRAENAAATARLGLWFDQDRVAPWLWRKFKRGHLQTTEDSND